MREPINEGQVEKAHRALCDCVDLIERHFRYCAGLQGKYPIGTWDRPIPLSEEELGPIVQAVKAIREGLEMAERLAAPLDRDLPALYDAPVKVGNVIASSWTEATLKEARAHASCLEDWERFRSLEPRKQQAQFSACFGHMPNVAEYQAGLKIEAAKLRDRAVAMTSDVRFGFVLRELSPQSARLMQVLIDREGRRVEYQEVGDALWGDDGAPNRRIHKAMFRLKRELEGLGAGEIGRDIRSEAGAYQFRGGSR